jgi:hypothetical protein
VPLHECRREFENYPIGGGKPDTTCKLIKGCPTVYPLVVCELLGSGHGSHEDVVDPGGSTYLSKFLSPPFTS